MSGDVTSLIELNDADILRLEGVFRRLQSRQGERLNIEAFRQEMCERFADVGFEVFVQAHYTNIEGVYAFDITINDRLEGQFDPDQMVHEVTNDLLGLGTGGIIKSDLSGKTASGLWTPGSHNH